MNLDALTHHLRAKSAALLVQLEGGLDRLLLGWLLVAGLASAARIAVHPAGSGDVGLATIIPYLLLVGAPAASLFLALRWFADGPRLPQPDTRMAVVGKWREVRLEQAERHPLYGAGGLMVSLMIGMLLNVPVRAAEYLAAMPALSGRVPSWLGILHTMLTLDVVLLTSLYVIAFVAALRRAPLFPRLLVATWMVDLLMQVGTAQVLGHVRRLPPDVAAALHGLLDGNVKKVLISIGLWLPYLLLSRRVNLTYRLRVAA